MDIFFTDPSSPQILAQKIFFASPEAGSFEFAFTIGRDAIDKVDNFTLGFVNDEDKWSEKTLKKEKKREKNVKIQNQVRV